MAFTDNLDPRKWESWELSPSTRQSMSLWTKWYPVNSTIAVAGTAQNLITVSPGLATVNLITNPSFETGDPPTGFTASGATLAQNGTYYKYGSYSMEVDPDNSAANEGFYYNLGVLPSGIPISISCWARDVAASGNGVRVRLYAVTDASYTNGSTVALSSSWQRSKLVTILPKTQTQQSYYLYVTTVTQHNTTFYVDGIQAEVLDNCTDYCDGSQGLYHWWDGTAHASTSRRWKKQSHLRGYTLHTTRDIYIAMDIVASSTTGRLVKAGTDFWLDYPVYIKDYVSFINANAGETPQVYGEFWGI